MCGKKKELIVCYLQNSKKMWKAGRVNRKVNKQSQRITDIIFNYKLSYRFSLAKKKKKILTSIFFPAEAITTEI